MASRYIPDVTKLAVAAALLVFSSAVALVGSSPAAAVAGFDSAYRFESAFLTGLKAGDTGQFSVFFDNTGTLAWATGTATQVDLAACLDDKVTCNVAPEEAAWNPGNWVSTTSYATQGKPFVGVGDFTAFTYSIKVPTDAQARTYTFNGDLVVATSRQKIHPEGYFQQASVTPAPPVPPSGLLPATDLLATVGNFDSGPANDDVRLSFITPAANGLALYDVQRSPELCPVAPTAASWITVTTLTLTGGNQTATDSDRPSGRSCYQIRTRDPNSADAAFSNQQGVTVFAASDSVAPTSTSAVLSQSADSSLNSPDIVTITFSEKMLIASAARIRVTDGDCGPPASQSSGPPGCPGGQSQTIADIACGTNMSCALSFDGLTLTLSMTANPLDVAAGTSPGVQFPAVMIESLGITDLAGNPWNIAGSADRVFGPVGQ